MKCRGNVLKTGKKSSILKPRGFRCASNFLMIMFMYSISLLMSLLKCKIVQYEEELSCSGLLWKALLTLIT